MQARTRNPLVVAGLAGLAGLAGTGATVALRQRRPGRSVTVRQAVTVAREADPVAAIWRDVRLWPRFVPGLRLVDSSPDGTSFRAVGEDGARWEIRTVEDGAVSGLAWETLGAPAGMPVQLSVSLHSAPGGRGTEVHARATYRSPLPLGPAAVAGVLAPSPAQSLRRWLRRMKTLAEVGEIPRVPDETADRGPATARLTRIAGQLLGAGGRT